MTGSPKSQSDKTSTAGRSERDTSKPASPKRDAGPDREKGGVDLPDAAENAGFKRKSGRGDQGHEAPPGAIPLDELTTENDDGAG